MSICCYSLQYSLSTEEDVQINDYHFNHYKSFASRHNCQCPTTLSKHLEAIFDDINLSLNKSDASLFPLKPSLSHPGTARPPSNPPNPEVIVAGGCPTWLCSDLKNTLVGKFMLTIYKLQTQSFLVVPWIKINNFIYTTAFSATELRDRNQEDSTGMSGEDLCCLANCQSHPRLRD